LDFLWLEMALAQMHNETHNGTRNGLATITARNLHIEVNYGLGYVPFVMNGSNDHQLDALGTFLSSQTEVVVVPHADGKDFIALFLWVDSQTVKYFKENGSEVFFRLS